MSIRHKSVFEPNLKPAPHRTTYSYHLCPRASLNVTDPYTYSSLPHLVQLRLLGLEDGGAHFLLLPFPRLRDGAPRPQ